MVKARTKASGPMMKNMKNAQGLSPRSKQLIDEQERSRHRQQPHIKHKPSKTRGSLHIAVNVCRVKKNEQPYQENIDQESRTETDDKQQ